LAKCSQRQRQHGSEGKREQFLHKTMSLGYFCVALDRLG
jgi:hypothetical protein